MSRRLSSLLQGSFVVGLLFGGELSAKSTRFEIRDAAQRDVVQFVSETPLEKVVGLTNAISGWVEIDPDKVNSGIKGEFEVDTRTFETGSGFRNEHLKDKFLGTSEFPHATVILTKLLSSSKNTLIDGQPVTLRVEGNLKVKGINRLQNFMLKATYFKRTDATAVRASGNLLKISGSFDLDLTNFGIPIPEGMKFRIARFVQVLVDVIGSDGAIPPILTSIPEAPPKPK